jgi:hypothetical protein
MQGYFPLTPPVQILPHERIVHRGYHGMMKTQIRNYSYIAITVPASVQTFPSNDPIMNHAVGLY